MISRHPRYIFIADDRLATARESAGDQRRGNSTLGRPYLTAELLLTTTLRLYDWTRPRSGVERRRWIR